MTVLFHAYVTVYHNQNTGTKPFSGTFLQFGQDYVIDDKNGGIPVTVAIVNVSGTVMHAVPSSMTIVSGTFPKQ